MHFSLQSLLKLLADLESRIPDHTNYIAVCELLRCNAVRAILYLKLIVKRMLHAEPLFAILTATPLIHTFYLLNIKAKATKLLKKRRSSAKTALSKFIHPPSDMPWPQSCIDLIQTAEENIDNAVISFSLRLLRTNIGEGHLELCNSSKHLLLFMSDELFIDGWHISMAVTENDLEDAEAFLASRQNKSQTPRFLPSAEDLLSEEGRKAAFEIAKTRIFHRQYRRYTPRFDEKIMVWPLICRAPYGCMKAHIRSIQEHLSAISARLSVITYTTHSKSANPPQTQPTRKYAQPRYYSKQARQRRMSQDNSLAELEDVLELLTTGPHALRIRSIKDISKNHAYMLHKYAEEINRNLKGNRQIVESTGAKAWRREHLDALISAASYGSRRLTRWIIFLEKCNELDSLVDSSEDMLDFCCVSVDDYMAADTAIHRARTETSYACFLG